MSCTACTFIILVKCLGYESPVRGLENESQYSYNTFICILVNCIHGSLSCYTHSGLRLFLSASLGPSLCLFPMLPDSHLFKLLPNFHTPCTNLHPCQHSLHHSSPILSLFILLQTMWLFDQLICMMSIPDDLYNNHSN